MPRQGLPKSIIKKYGISKKAWEVFRGKRSSGKRKRKANKPRTRTYVRRKTYMPRRRRSRARSFLSFQSITKFIKIGALVAPAVDIYSKSGGGLQGAANALTAYAGYNTSTGQFDFGVMQRAWMPYVMTTLVTTGISKLNGIIKRL